MRNSLPTYFNRHLLELLEHNQGHDRFNRVDHPRSISLFVLGSFAWPYIPIKYYFGNSVLRLFSQVGHSITHLMTNEIAFLTCHQKETVVAPILKKQGFLVRLESSFDTDSLGTFTGETPRALTQIQAALKKAQLATEITSCRYGLGSEGSFGPHPQVYLLPWNLEVLALWDRLEEHAIYAILGTSETNFASEKVSSLNDAMAFAAKSDFPSHALILGTPTDSFFTKGISKEAEFQDRVKAALKKNPSVWLETDMRAHMNPSRMRSIQHTTEKLSALLLSYCPQCHLPGYGLTELIKGAPCEICAAPTRLPRAEKWSCLKCDFTELHPLHAVGPAKNCDACNP